MSLTDYNYFLIFQCLISFPRWILLGKKNEEASALSEFFKRVVPFDKLTWISSQVSWNYFLQRNMLNLATVSDSIPESRSFLLCDVIRNKLTGVPERLSLPFPQSSLPFPFLTDLLSLVIQSYGPFWLFANCICVSICISNTWGFYLVNC